MNKSLLKALLIAISLNFVAVTSQAAMIPYYDSANEIAEIVQNQEVAKKLGTLLPIEKIEHFTTPHSFNSSYEVSAKKQDNSSSPAKILLCKVSIEVTYTSPDGGWQQDRHLSVGEGTCSAID